MRVRSEITVNRRTVLKAGAGIVALGAVGTSFDSRPRARRNAGPDSRCSQ